MREWETTAAAYAVVQEGSILARTHQAKAAIARETARKRRNEMVEQGMNRRQRLRAMRQEEINPVDTERANREGIVIRDDSEEEEGGTQHGETSHEVTNHNVTNQDETNRGVTNHGTTNHEITPPDLVVTNSGSSSRIGRILLHRRRHSLVTLY
jgi:hypothetical protein